MNYVIYLAIAALVVWAVWYLVRHIRRQTKGGCGCGCQDCRQSCNRREN